MNFIYTQINESQGFSNCQEFTHLLLVCTQHIKKNYIVNNMGLARQEKKTMQLH